MNCPFSAAPIGAKLIAILVFVVILTDQRRTLRDRKPRRQLQLHFVTSRALRIYATGKPARSCRLRIIDGPRVKVPRRILLITGGATFRKRESFASLDSL